jgi:hypothetical protein
MGFPLFAVALVGAALLGSTAVTFGSADPRIAAGAGAGDVQPALTRCALQVRCTPGPGSPYATSPAGGHAVIATPEHAFDQVHVGNVYIVPFFGGQIADVVAPVKKLGIVQIPSTRLPL